MTISKPKIAVVGSINMDLVIRCDRIPVGGETVLAQSAEEICGGKGANQAVAAAKAGAEVALVGRVGSDAFHERLLANLTDHEVDASSISVTEDCSSGLAIISVQNDGQNAISVVPGANGRLTNSDVVAAREVIASADIVLLQLEIPIETVITVVEIARNAGKRVILDPAPAPRQLDQNQLLGMLQVDLLCPNESEAAALVDHPVQTVDQARAAASTLQRWGAQNVAITMGRHGTVLRLGDEDVVVPAYQVQAVDTTAAGDAFAGALACQWMMTDDLVESVRFANAAGGLAASKAGAQPSLASRFEIETLWRSQ